MHTTSACALTVGVLLVGCGTAPAQRAAPPSSDPSRITYVRLYCSPDNESHFETVTVDLGRVDAARPAPPFFAKVMPASRMVFAGFDAHWGTHDLQARTFHAAPAAQFVLYLQGTMAITVTDGETRNFGPGDVLRTEDVAPCKGHLSVVGDSPSFTAITR
jgi:hypothetical protein